MYSIEIIWTFDGKDWRTIIVKKKINLKKKELKIIQMNCIKLLLSYLNYKLNMRIKKIEIERLKEVRLIRSSLQVYKIATGILVCYRFLRSYRMGVRWQGSILAAWWLCCGSVRDRLHSSIIIQQGYVWVALCYCGGYNPFP